MNKRKKKNVIGKKKSADFSRLNYCFLRKRNKLFKLLKYN